MLDDLSENDPAAYRKLTEDLKTGGKQRLQPVLHSTVCTQILVSLVTRAKQIN